jgi:hypothetical protein
VLAQLARNGWRDMVGAFELARRVLKMTRLLFWGFGIAMELNVMQDFLDLLSMDNDVLQRELIELMDCPGLQLLSEEAVRRFNSRDTNGLRILTVEDIECELIKYKVITEEKLMEIFDVNDSKRKSRFQQIVNELCFNYNGLLIYKGLIKEGRTKCS